MLFSAISHVVLGYPTRGTSASGERKSQDGREARHTGQQRFDPQLDSALARVFRAHGRPGVPLAQGVFCILVTICPSSYIITVTLGQWDSRTVVGYEGLIRPGVPLIRGGRPRAGGCP